ncbi:MAG: 30S ribosomal protein S20 [Candidatus Omnitrophica bacterium]|nr:30S ribosomal protein S20 [Candidatus Omnitrophota bacterium]
MPQRKCAVKALKQNRKSQMHNLDMKSALRKATKEFMAATKTDLKKAAELLPLVYKKIDKAAKKNVLNKKNASHKKSKYARFLLVKPATQA